MAINNQVEAKVKLSAVKEYLGGNGSLNKIAEKYGICRSTLQKWLLNYRIVWRSWITASTSKSPLPGITEAAGVGIVLVRAVEY